MYAIRWQYPTCDVLSVARYATRDEAEQAARAAIEQGSGVTFYRIVEV